MKLEISHSSSSMARACPMKYNWRYVQGYKPLRKSSALALGSVIHEAFDKYYQGDTDAGACRYIANTMDDQLSSASLTEREDLEKIKHTALGMWTNYPSKNLKEFQEIKSEKEFKVRLGKLRNVLFVGKTDRLIKKDGKWWVGELKTTGLPFQNFKNRMSTSAQVTAYVYAWRMKGYPVEGVIFDFIKKPLLRKGVNESSMDYCVRIRDDYSRRPAQYFARHFEYRSDADIQRWLRDTVSTVKNIRRIWRGECNRNPDNCWNYNSECPYKKICFTDTVDPLTVQLYFEVRK